MITIRNIYRVFSLELDSKVKKLDRDEFGSMMLSAGSHYCTDRTLLWCNLNDELCSFLDNYLVEDMTARKEE